MNNGLLKYYKDKCELCANLCGTDRESGKGMCNADKDIYVASATLHFGEEPPISGTRGSGTIFFTHCSLHCDYCQNYPLSQMGVGNHYTIERLSDKMIDLQTRGAHNINFVTPTHYSYHLYESVFSAKEKGLNIPIVWNTSSYENPETVGYIDEIVDIYLADMRYSNDKDAYDFSHVSNYTNTVRQNIKRFHKSKSNLVISDDGIAVKGLLIRILLLPNKVNEMREILDFIKNEIGNDAFISIMSQYVPYYKAFEHGDLKRRVTLEEYEEIVEYADKLNFENAFIQETANTEE
jgi:putative pyruvate formate lyase activating enzyme